MITVKPLLNLVKLAKKKFKDYVLRVLSDFNIVDSIPDSLPLMEDVLAGRMRGLYKDGSSVVVAAKIGDLWSDPTYNRTDSINYGNCERDLKSLKVSHM